MEEIKFYKKGQPYYEFSNYFPCDIIIDDIQWKSTEHYYQAMKYPSEYADIIRMANTPNKARILANRKKLRGWETKWKIYKNGKLLTNIIEEYKDIQPFPDYEERRIDVMKKALQAKFAIPVFRRLLQSTENKLIIEDSPNDTFWGIGQNGTGQNNLGKLIMEIRDNL